MSTANVVIKSADSSGQLTFSNLDGENFLATFESSDLRISKRVWGYTDCASLVELFQSITLDWKGWNGERTWSSVEGEFQVTATSDRLGHIALTLRFVQVDGSEPWKAEPMLNVEAGQLAGILESVQRFFK